MLCSLQILGPFTSDSNKSGIRTRHRAALYFLPFACRAGLGSHTQASDVALQAVHLVSPSSSIFSQLLISSDTRPNNSDPVGAGCIRSAAGCGSFGAPLGELAEQPINPAALSNNSFFSSLTRQDGAAVFGISTISFLLPCPLDSGLAFFDFGLPGVRPGLVLAGAVPAHAQRDDYHQGRTNLVGQRGTQ